MGKKSRARVAAAGTRKDPGRRVAEGEKANRAEKGKKVGAHAHPEWAPHLNSASEDLTAKLFTMVEVILGVVPVVVIGLFLASKDATSVEKLTEVFSQEPSMVVTFISACLQPFVAYMLYMIYRKYCEGDAGFAAGNLIGLLCSEILLLNIPGVIGMGILLWRVWRNVAPHFESWLFERRFAGVVADIAGSLVILALAFLCATAARGLAGMWSVLTDHGAQGGETFPSRSRLRRVARGEGFPALRPGVGSSHARYRKADKKFACRPFWGGTFLYGVPVSTIFVKLLVRFWSVGVRVEGQKIVGEKSSEKVLVGELLSFSTAFEQKKLCGYCRRLRCRGHGGAGCWS